MKKGTNSTSVRQKLKNSKKFIFIAIFLLIGGMAVVFSRAGTFSITLETEGGTLNNVTSIEDGSASGGRAVQFKGSSGGGGDSIVVATAGDIADGDHAGQRETAELIKRIRPNYVIPLGDNAYSDGKLSEYNSRYAPYWGVAEILSITKPVLGNHEYKTSGASGYFDYFDPGRTNKFGARDKGYYSFTDKNWLFLNINSECSKISGGCSNSGAQARWVDQQLSANPGKCVVASWHKPRVTKGEVHNDYTEMNDIWNKVYDRGGVVLTGHNHFYTRSNPLGQNAQQTNDGIEQFVVGTGGTNSFYSAGSDSRQAKTIDNTWGILKLVLQNNNSYSYEFIDVNNRVLDQGSKTLNCN